MLVRLQTVVLSLSVLQNWVLFRLCFLFFFVFSWVCKIGNLLKSTLTMVLNSLYSHSSYLRPYHVQKKKIQTKYSETENEQAILKLNHIQRKTLPVLHSWMVNLLCSFDITKRHSRTVVFMSSLQMANNQLLLP